MHCYLIYTLLRKKSNHVGVKHLSQSRRLPLLQVVSNNKSFSVGVQSPTEINAPRECAVILRRICQLSLTRITHQVSRAFDLNRFFRMSKNACFSKSVTLRLFIKYCKIRSLKIPCGEGYKYYYDIREERICNGT